MKSVSVEGSKFEATSSEGRCGRAGGVAGACWAWAEAVVNRMDTTVRESQSPEEDRELMSFLGGGETRAPALPTQRNETSI